MCQERIKGSGEKWYKNSHCVISKFCLLFYSNCGKSCTKVDFIPSKHSREQENQKEGNLLILSEPRHS